MYAIRSYYALTVGFFCVGNVRAADDQNYLLATASTGGTYYPVGVALSTLTKVKLQPSHKISMSAISSAGSGENIKLLRDNEVQFAILQGLYGYYAWNGRITSYNVCYTKLLREIQTTSDSANS